MQLHRRNKEAVAACSSYNNKILHNYCHMTCFTTDHLQNYLFMRTTIKMAFHTQGIRLTSDHTLETASEVMQILKMDRRLPNGRESYLKLLEDLDFPSNQDGGDQHTQFVFQGQCIILGDARVGKTSLKKSLTGETFNAEEPRTKGVEVSLVDRKWKTSDPTTGLSFGSFAHFAESALYKCALYGPGGVEFVISEDMTSFFSAGRLLFSSLGIISWVISFIWLLSSAEMSVTFRAFSFSTFLIAILLRFIRLEDPEAYILSFIIVTILHFTVGLGTAYLLSALLKNIECSNLKFSSSEEHDSCGNQIVWTVHLLIFAAMFDYIFFKVSLMKKIRYYFNFVNLSEVDSTVPGNAIFKDSLPILPRIVFFIVPIISGFSFGCIIGLSTEPSDYKHCAIFYSTAFSLFCYLIYMLAKTCLSWVNWQGQVVIALLLYISMEKADLSLFSFCSLKVYMAMFSVWACQTLYEDWDGMNVFFTSMGNIRETRANFTLILIEKIMLNFRKLKVALHNKFCNLKLNLLDFAGDKEYYAYHHIFMRDQAIYIVAFNMANFANDNFRNIETKIQRLRFWMESICSKARPKTPIFLVGTHRGNMPTIDLKTIDKHLQQHLMYSFSDELMMNKEDKLLYFPTENTRGRKDQGIQNLQKEIMSTAEELRPIMGREIPYSWIKIQDAIINLSENRNAKFCVPLRKFPVSVGNFICSNWSRETLKYFHEKGLVIYNHDRQGSELSSWILLKPAILVDIIIQLVSPLTDEEVYFQRGFRRDWKLLHETGMLTESLLKHILSRFQENDEAMKGFLEEYDIICPLFFHATNQEEEAQVTHFIPSLLPVSTMATVTTPVWFDGPYDKTFYVFFNRFLPQALFQHLLSRAHRNSKAEFVHGQPVICQDVGRFWLRPNQPYRLLQLKDEDIIEVTFTYKRLV